MIAITGANGLLGSFVVRKLLDAGESFVAFKRPGSDISLLKDLEAKITWREADVLNTVALDTALADITTVIHTAALVSYNPRDKKNLYNNNVIGTRNIINASLANSVTRFLHVSSVAALGRQKGLSFVDENQKWVNSPLNTTYGETKYLAELEVMRGQEEGLSTDIVNPSLILAPADWNRSSAMIFKYVWQEKSFYTDGELNYVDVRDVADIIYRLLRAPREGERFIANAGTISYKLLFENIAHHFKKKSPSIKLSKQSIRMLAWLENMRSLITGASPLITRETARLSGASVFYSNEKVKNKLNFNFIPLEKTLEWCCGYYIGQGKGEK